MGVRTAFVDRRRSQPAFFPIERWLFLRAHPTARLYYDDLNVDEIAKLDLEGRLALFDSFQRFASIRARWVLRGSALKVLPSLLLVNFYWQHPTRSDLGQFFIIAAIAVANAFSFTSFVYCHAHTYLSRAVARLHEAQDWSKVFERAWIREPSNLFEAMERLSLGRLFLVTVLLATAIVLNHPATESNPMLALKLGVISVSGFMLFSRVLHLHRRYLIGSLVRMFEMMNSFERRKLEVVLPLHTTPLLARFEQTFNRLVARVRSGEKELGRMIVQEAEKSRYSALGEISALVAHDLSGPLHVIRFCVDQLKAEPVRVSDPRYIEQLSANVQASLSLIESLRARIRNPAPSSERTTVYGDAHAHVVRLLSTQFSSRGFERIRFNLGTGVELLSIGVPNVDLIHIVDNLYRNAVANLLAHAVEDAMITVRSVDSPVGSIGFLISDNGTGLSRSRFEELSGGASGLRLTTQLIKQHGGSLEIIEDSSNSGTTFALRLRSALRPELAMSSLGVDG